MLYTCLYVKLLNIGILHIGVGTNRLALKIGRIQVHQSPAMAPDRWIEGDECLPVVRTVVVQFHQSHQASNQLPLIFRFNLNVGYF